MKLVIGGSGGVGQGLIEAWSGTRLSATYHRQPGPQTDVDWHSTDVTESGWAETLLNALPETPRVCVLSTGVLHDEAHRPEKSVREFDPAWFQRNLALNTQPFFELAAALTRRTRRDDPLTLAVLSAKVGSIEDNRLGGWYSYRASKAALNMLVRTTAIEWRHRLPNATVLALHPGTTDSRLSEPFQQRLPPGQLHSPARTGAALSRIIDAATQADSGRFYSWDGSLLPW